MEALVHTPSFGPGGAIVMKPDSKERYSRQVLFGPLGEPGQARLLASRVCIVGCGATGSALASLLARAGVGFLRIIDRDFVEPSNLQRQNLFDEKDAAESRSEERRVGKECRSR